MCATSKCPFSRYCGLHTLCGRCGCSSFYVLLATPCWPTGQWQILPEFTATHLRCFSSCCPCAVTPWAGCSWHPVRMMLCLAWAGVAMLVGSHLAMSKQIAIPAISTPTPIPTSYKKNSCFCHSCWQLFFQNPSCNSSVTAQLSSCWSFSSSAWPFLGKSPPDCIAYFSLLPSLCPHTYPPHPLLTVIYLTRWWYARHLPSVGCASTHTYANLGFVLQ